MKTNYRYLNLLAILLTLLIFSSCSTPTDPNGDKISSVNRHWMIPRDNLWELSMEWVQPAIENGKVYYISDASLVCRELESGDEIWKTNMGNTTNIFSNKLIFSDNKLFINHRDYVRCYNAEDGSLVWTNNSPEIGSLTHHSILAETQSDLFVSSYNKVFRLSKADGEINKLIQIQSQVSGSRYAGRIEKITVSEENYLYIPSGYYPGGPSGNTDGYIWCYNSEGEYIWEYKIPHRKYWFPGAQDSVQAPSDALVCALFEDYVVTKAGKSVMALNRFTGELIWEKFFENDSFLFGGLAAANGKVFAGSNGDYIYCFDIETGEQLWKVHTGATVASPIIPKGKVLYYCNNFGSGIWIIDQDNGNVIWHEKETSDGGYYSPLAVNDDYMVNIGNMNIFCFKLN